ncbi:MAG: ribbon-helix-helix protein, CopG family [Gammaproteobacteria bacterium]|nr:ribbon-helix-helix protein, CopG family [Gammaproteobacteria bacterium]
MHVDNSSNRIRLSLDVSPKVNDQLEALAEEEGTSKSDIMRKAIALVTVAVEAKQKGQKLGILDKDRQVLSEIIGL